MPVKHLIQQTSGIYFITFTCYQWLPLIAQTNAYDAVYKWFDYLQSKQHKIGGYVIMPNHLHLLIWFAPTNKIINRIVGDGKRFLAYELVKRLETTNQTALLQQLAGAVRTSDGLRNKQHELWEPSFDWKHCRTEAFANQKLAYIHSNPCSGKWMLAASPTAYEHSSARFYMTGKHAAYTVTDIAYLLALDAGAV